MNRGLRAAGRRTSRAAFTLIELMLVIVILGIVAAIVVPQFGAGMSGAKLRVGARTVIQAARYARTMALLHQAETDLVLLPLRGLVRVEASPASRENRVFMNDPDTQAAFDAPSPAPPARAGRAAELATGADKATDGEGDFTNQPVAMATSAAFADEIRAEFECHDVQFRFLGYTDSDVAEADEDAILAPAEAGREIRIPYRSNGICRPFRLAVLRDENDRLEIVFDITDTGAVVAP